MLPVQHKITSSEEFRKTIRSGKRAGGRTVVLHVLLPHYSSNRLMHSADNADSENLVTYAPRCGLVVSKAVGNAVTRHAVSRKLRAIMHKLIDDLPSGALIVVRALPMAASASSEELSQDVQRALTKIRRA